MRGSLFRWCDKLSDLACGFEWGTATHIRSGMSGRRPYDFLVEAQRGGMIGSIRAASIGFSTFFRSATDRLLRSVCFLQCAPLLMAKSKKKHLRVHRGLLRQPQRDIQGQAASHRHPPGSHGAVYLRLWDLLLALDGNRHRRLREGKAGWLLVGASPVAASPILPARDALSRANATNEAFPFVL